MNEIRAAVRAAKNTVMQFTDVEVKVRDATSNDPWGPSSTLMADIARATHDYQEYPKLFHRLWARLNDVEHVMHVQKSLILVDYLLRNGAERFINDAKRRARDIAQLQRFKHYDENNNDDAKEARYKAKMVYELLMNDKQLAEERAKAKNIMDVKAQGFGGGGGYDEYGGGGGRYGGDGGHYGGGGVGGADDHAFGGGGGGGIGSSERRHTAAHDHVGAAHSNPDDWARSNDGDTAVAASTASAATSAEKKKKKKKEKKATEDAAKAAVEEEEEEPTEKAEKKEKKKKEKGEKKKTKQKESDAAADDPFASGAAAASADPFASSSASSSSSSSSAAAKYNDFLRDDGQPSKPTNAGSDEFLNSLHQQATNGQLFTASRSGGSGGGGGGGSGAGGEIDIMTGGNGGGMTIADMFANQKDEEDDDDDDDDDSDEEDKGNGNVFDQMAAQQHQQQKAAQAAVQADPWQAAAELTNLDNIREQERKPKKKVDESGGMTMSMMRSIQPLGTEKHTVVVPPTMAPQYQVPVAVAPGMMPANNAQSTALVIVPQQAAYGYVPGMPPLGVAYGQTPPSLGGVYASPFPTPAQPQMPIRTAPHYGGQGGAPDQQQIRQNAANPFFEVPRAAAQPASGNNNAANPFA